MVQGGSEVSLNSVIVVGALPIAHVLWGWGAVGIALICLAYDDMGAHVSLDYSLPGDWVAANRSFLSSGLTSVASSNVCP